MLDTLLSLVGYEALSGWGLGQSISGHKLQTIRKLAKNCFDYI